ncbi:hypothetical protein SAMN05428975_2362 [Mucilaginibacter sp. OK268]|uniref:hypothetical protein n=1 Tax=Mucilaginibacter sp. OK268 TaxID=1881048 RepID=UPI00088DC4CD|nr:hypothetical protein [Mucilaginibacter sp. OK268]SDP72853.1 hypothetical protein SAMN05428975_2362 [Mucilaginibacter sp. OK268]
MQQPLTKVLLKVFAGGFYQVHAGILFVVFFIMVGTVPGNMLITYHKSLMLAMTSSPIMLALVLAVWLVYIFKSWHYVSTQIFAPDKQFLFYSSTVLSRSEQRKSWCYMQAAILAPVIIYALLTIGVGLANHLYILPAVIILFLSGMIWCSAVLYVRVMNGLIDGSKQSLLLRWSSKWRKPYFSLYIYHIFDDKKVSYFITKGLSWLIISGVFYLFADVSTDTRLAGIAILAVITAHVILIFEERRFEETKLSFARNLPISRFRLFLNFAGGYFFLLLPESVWLFSRFHPLMAVELLLTGLSIALLFHSLLYWFGLNMDQYLQWILGLFIVLFWVIMFRLLWVLIPLNLVIAYLFFYNNYYRYEGVVNEK